ncbi:hypothetical protein [Paracholeplasma manati]|uniref:Uncharacterized protein n=1 Tax=Paracholeplasma manati TaxID=591373 RepID=A0ABT2Y8P8_9MOLU|nr:hypothetical protein [Paracholeplasma manati]MCV2232903.1 hypothetical protein [Paracholeplasma manati]MDG0888658.1 hypothetical protein [Paracholeplasma manati]
MRIRIFDLVVMAIFTAIIFVVEQALSFIPNVQLTVFLFVLYTRLIGSKKTLFIVVVHTLLDNIYMGTLIWHLVIPMMMAWSLIPILLGTVFKKVQGVIGLSIFAFGFGFIYGMMFIPFQAYVWGYDMWLYFMYDLPFEFAMGISGALSVAVLYQPVYYYMNYEISNYQLLDTKRYVS